ncbi:MAG: NAD(P)H-hydrate dehydratase [Brevibacillus sp.]|nr:NAD(P)H-hydrate dehydratase [Brevibacillus sp.]
MFVVTSAEMRKLDQYVIEQIGIPSMVLMENAGSAIAREVERFWRERAANSSQPAHWLILAGSGNNGGDGVVAARHLAEVGFRVTILYVKDPASLRGDAARQRDAAQHLGIPSLVYGSDAIDWTTYDGIVDALLGTGSQGPPRGPYADLIRAANESGLPIIAIDIPSGLDADTGQTFDPCIRAVKTVALAFLKRGLVQYPGREAAGEVAVARIGIWPQFADQFAVKCFLLGEEFFEQHFAISPHLPRRADAHKGTYGHVLVCAGSLPMSGAGLLCAKAALRAGCGLVTWAVPDRLLPALIGHLPEVMLAAISDGWAGPTSADELLQLMRGCSAAVIGPGMGRFPGDSTWLRTIWEGSDCPLVLDADALNMLADAGDFSTWSKRRAPTILTPHPGEMARLAKMTTSEVQGNRIECARSYAVRHQLTLVLKGGGTVVATKDETVYINPAGNAGMATGGSGDVLAGMIGSLLAQGFSAEQAACLGVWLHATAGDRAAARRHAAYSLIAGDIVEEL